MARPSTAGIAVGSIGSLHDDGVGQKALADLGQHRVLPVTRSRQDNLHRLAHGEHLRHQHLRQSCSARQHPSRESFEGPLRRAAEIASPCDARQPQQRQGHHGIPRRLRSVVIVLETQQQIALIGRRTEESAAFFILKQTQRAFRQPRGPRQIGRVEGGFIQIDQCADQRRVIVQESLDGRLAFAIPPQKRRVSLTPQMPIENIPGIARRLCIAGLVKYLGSLGERRNHHAVPAAEDFVVEMRTRPPRANFEQLRYRPRQRFVRHILRLIKNVSPGKLAVRIFLHVPIRLNAEPPAEYGCIALAEDIHDSPDGSRCRTRLHSCLLALPDPPRYRRPRPNRNPRLGGPSRATRIRKCRGRHRHTARRR